MNRFYTILVFATTVGLSEVYGQQTEQLTYTIEASVTASPVITFFQHPRYPGAPDDPLVGYGVFGRIMWHPDRYLALGVMSGYTMLADEEISMNIQPTNETTSTRASLVAVPLQAVISMQTQQLEIGFGMGPYIVTGTIQNGVEASGRRLELGITLFSSYRFPLTQNISLAPELRVLYMQYRGMLSIMPSISMRINAFEY